MENSKQSLEDNFVSYVDPFIGSEACDLPEGQGIAASWWTAKPPVGNTHPGASLPFGFVSACAYSGAYVTGYGRYDLSLSGDMPNTIYDQKLGFGISHFQQSGTGRIRVYYNYFLTTPLTHTNLKSLTQAQVLVDEQASPGYYQTTFQESQVVAKVVAAKKGVKHSYQYPEECEQKVAIVNINSGGLLLEGMATRASQATIQLDSHHQVSGCVRLEGIDIYFTCICKDGKAELWDGVNWMDEAQLHKNLQSDEGFGFGFKSEGVSNTLELDFSFSLQEQERTCEDCQAQADLTFNQLLTQAHSTWETELEKITIEGASEDEKTLFYTSLYRSQIKPANFTHENPFRKESSGPFFFDLSTLWDLYKTHLPLLFTLQPELGEDFVTFLLEVAKREGSFPVSYLMDNAPDRFTKQATGLCHMILEDARQRGINADWEQVLKLMWKTSQKKDTTPAKFAYYAKHSEVQPLTHTLDISYAHFCTAQMAKSQGVQYLHDRSSSLVSHWKKAFDPQTGLLRDDSDYYEGENWNYSFRFLHNMEERIELAGGKERFCELLDTFFGYIPSDTPTFEGMNNEPDMEAPYAYLYIGRHDRTAEVVTAALRQRFANYSWRASWQ